MHDHHGNAHSHARDLRRGVEGEAVLRSADGHRVHLPGTAGALDRRRFMTALFAGAGVAAFASLAASCCSDGSSTTTTPSAGPGGSPPGGGAMGNEGITEEAMPN